MYDYLRLQELAVAFINASHLTQIEASSPELDKDSVLESLAEIDAIIEEIENLPPDAPRRFVLSGGGLSGKGLQIDVTFTIHQPNQANK